ncbi:MAG: YfhO family protein, partial [Clostridia bacterium]|nr:YfhO family protein [Clostridia bacterium]
MKTLKKLSPFIAFLGSLLVFMVVFALNGIYPFGERSISWCDMNQQTIPLLCEFKDVLSGKSDFWLSLENAGGMNFYGVYFFNLSSPFTYLIVFFDKTEIPQAVNLMVVLKLSFAALTFAFWLKRFASGANPLIVVAVSIVYAFSGYGMMYYQILSWLDTVYLFPLLLIGLDNLTKEKSPLVYILVLFSCILCHFYLGYAIVLFVCLYGGAYMLICKEKRVAFAKNFVISSILAALLSAIVIIPVFLQYL